MMAEDKFDRAVSDDPTVHRELVVVDPPMRGRDVANVNRATRERLAARGLADDVPAPTHDRFTHAAAVAAVEAQYALGLRSDTYLRVARVGDERRIVLTEGAQAVIRDPLTRDAQQRERAKGRAKTVAEGPRYYDQLARQAGATGRGMVVALDYARKYAGTKERPPGSNWGGMVETWIRLTGYTSPVPWCGCFANACVIAGGVPNGRGWIGYTPAIVAHARAGRGGWSWHGTAQGKPGDLALFDTPGGDPAVHVGIVIVRLSTSSYRTIEGNTSNGRAGSQADGHGAFERVRSTAGSFRIIGFARPPYPA